jgi:hypothetical protein
VVDKIKVRFLHSLPVMILTDRGNRKPKEALPVKKGMTLEELAARVPKNEYPVGKAKIEFFECDCGLTLDPDIEEGTQQAIWFWENVKNHTEDCEYVWWMSI